MKFNIGKVTFGDAPVIIAEAGVNHLGRLDYAEELVKTAARAGAHIVKFQTYKADKLTTKNAPRFWNWEGEQAKDGSQHDSYSLLDSFGEMEYKSLINICKKYGVEFMSTPFDEDSVDMLVGLGMQGFKIASCDINNIPFLRYIAKHNLPMLISTGAATVGDIRAAVSAIEAEGNRNILIMHCTLCYPTDPADSNLSALLDIKQHFPNYLLGLSDHTLGTIVPAASILYGVKAIEKHYTFDKTLPDSADHWLSLNEPELSQLVSQVNELNVAVGIGKKVVLDCELPAHQYARRSIVSNCKILSGTIITREMLAIKRPGTGLAPEYLDRIIGSTAIHDIEPDIILQIKDFN